MARADDGFTLRRAPGWPLAVTLGLHALLAWWWLLAPGPAAPDAGLAPRAFLVVPVWTAPSPIPEPAPPPLPSPRRLAPPAHVAARPAPADEPQPITAEAASLPADPPTSSPVPPADPLALPSPAAAAAAPAGDTVAARALRAAGGVERELRAGKLSALKPGDTPGQRLAGSLEAAHVETARSLTSESFTTPDGVTIYRFRIGGKVFCRSTGHVQPRLGNLAEGGGAASFDVAGGGGAAGLVPCPAHAEFKRD